MLPSLARSRRVVPRTVALLLVAAALGSCAPFPRYGSEVGVPVTPGPRTIALAMSQDSTPGFSGSCTLDGRTVVFSFAGYSGPNRLCSASCAFVDGGGAVLAARTTPSGVRPAASAGTEGFGAAADQGGPSAANAVRLVEGSGLGNCLLLY